MPQHDDTVSPGTNRPPERRSRSGQVQRFLADAGAALAASLDYEETLQTVARLAVPLIADWCSVNLRNDDGTISRVALAHTDPAMETILEQIRQHSVPGPNSAHPLAVALREGRPALYAEVTDDMLRSLARDAQHYELERRLGTRSVIIAPLLIRGRLIGALTLALSQSNRRFTPSDVAVAEDLARRAATAIENARLYRAAQDAIAARDEFLSVAAHELKTPVTSLRGYAQLLLRQVNRPDGIDPQRLRRGLMAIDAQSLKLASLIGQLLDTSRIQAGQLTLQPTRVDLTELVRSVVDAMQATTERHELVLRADRSIELPVDAIRIEQVLTNLLDNAVKYSPNGGVIVVELVDAAGAARVSVTDSGIGIPPEQRERVFDRFHQAHPGAPYGGMGLGLYISRQIVDLHGGSLMLEAPENGGSRFVMTLPLAGPPAS